MPLPVLFLGIAAASATGAIGVKKTVKAGLDTSAAKKINMSADQLIQTSKEKLNHEREACERALTNLGEEKVFILNNSIAEFLETFRQIKNVDFKDCEGLEELGKLHVDQATFTELGEMVSFAGSLASGAVAGTASGALTAFGAYGAAQMLAVASTGTAISTLSGAAATNATLAFFGGGSLAAGGLGMAGGTAVLGGLVAGPALMIMGTVVGAAAKKNLEKAYTNRAEAEQIAEELDTGSLQCSAIRRRTNIYYNLLARLDSKFLPFIYMMEDTVERSGYDYRAYSSAEKKVISSCVSFAVSIKSILDTALLNEDGSLTEDSAEIMTRYS